MGGGFTTYAVVVQLEMVFPKIVKSVDTYSIDVDDSNLVYKKYMQEILLLFKRIFKSY